MCGSATTAETLEPGRSFHDGSGNRRSTTIHMWIQIVGKVRMALAPPLNHWWHIPLYVSSRGLTTSPIPYGRRQFQVDLDFIEHRLDVTDTDRGVHNGTRAAIGPLCASTGSSWRDYVASGSRCTSEPRPVEVADAIPFEVDEVHASYDPGHARSLWRGLLPSPAC